MFQASSLTHTYTLLQSTPGHEHQFSGDGMGQVSGVVRMVLYAACDGVHGDQDLRFRKKQLEFLG